MMEKIENLVALPMTAPRDPDGFLTADAYDQKVKIAAYDAFLNKGMSLDDVAISQNIDIKVLAEWSREGKWLKRKKALEEEAMRSVELKHKHWALEEKYKEAQNQLAQARALQEELQKTLVAMRNGQPIKVTDMQLKRLSEALEAMTNVSARAVGLSDKTDQDEQRGGRTGRSKQPLVIIGMTPGVPTAGQEKPAIEIKTTEIGEELGNE